MIEQTEALRELKLIRQMMQLSRGYSGRLWRFFVIWGALGVAACVSSQAMLYVGRGQAIPWVWLAMFGTGFALSALAGRSDELQSGVASYVDRVVGSTWIAVTITVGLLAFAAPAAGGPFLFGAVPFVLGAGYFIMAPLLQSRSWLGGAAVWWLGGLALIARPESSFVILAAVMTATQLVPGVVLWRQSRGEGD